MCRMNGILAALALADEPAVDAQTFFAIAFFAARFFIYGPP